MARPLHAIAEDIFSDYESRGKEVHYSAAPYVRAMMALNTIEDNFYEDDGRSIVLYALSNLTSWRGPVAREVKAELKALLKK